MEERGKQFTDTTAENCGFNCCFMGRRRQKMKASKSESVWLKFRRRISRDGKSMTEYAVKISPAGNETETSDSFVLAFPQGGELIPVKIVSPVGKDENNQNISVKRRTKEGKARRLSLSWILRMTVRAFSFSTRKNPNGKVIHVPQPAGDSEIVAVQPRALTDSNQRPVEQQPSVVPFSHPRDSNQGPVEKSSEARNTIPVLNRKTRGIDRVHCHVTAPSSPMRGASPPRMIKIHRLASKELDSELAVKNPPHAKFQGRYAAIVFSVLIIILFCLLISDKLLAIVCASIWWYAVPKLRSIGRPEEPQRDPEVKKLFVKSLSNSNIDLHSSEYRKKVIMDGILQRNHKLT